MEKAEFKKYTVDFLNKNYPELEIKERESFELETKEGMVIFLEGSYAEAKKDNFEHIEIILNKLIKAYDSTKNQDFKWEDIKNKVYPQLKLASQLNLSVPPTIETTDEIVSDKFLGELRCAFVIDGGESFSYVSQKTLIDLGISLEELKNTALKNLTRLEDDTQRIQKMKDKQGNPFIFCDSNDGYSAARILLPNFYEKLSQELGEKFLVTIPERDFMLAGSIASVPVINQIMVENYSKSGHPICPVLLLRDLGGWNIVELRKEKTEEN